MKPIFVKKAWMNKQIPRKFAFYRVISLIAAFFALFVLCSHVHASTGLVERIDSIVRRPSQDDVRFAVRVVHAKTGKAIYGFRPVTPMIPASNMKIVTTAAAAEYLGWDYQFETVVGITPDEMLGVIGGGDPLLGDEKTEDRYGNERHWVFKDIGGKLRAIGVSKLNGVVVDSGFFDYQRVHPSWPAAQLHRYYACEVSGLNYNENCLKISVDNLGNWVRVNIEPETTYLKVVNKISPTSKGSSAVACFRTTTENKVILKGKCRKSASFDVAIERPAIMFGFLTVERLQQEGIEVDGKLMDKDLNPGRLRQLATYRHSIRDVIDRCNSDSFGLAAEALVKTISAENTVGKNEGSWQHGFQLIEAYLNDLGISDNQFELDDGSGLSKKNRLSPNAITTVLADMYKSSQWGYYKDSLAVGGVSGSRPVRIYFTNPNYRGKVYAKSGTVNGAKSLSGVCETKNGDYIFCIFANGKVNSKTRPAINDIVEAIIDYYD
jgi:D-alanyl-D-alanine carboxypeptidase/D-alanyl-D-alanine-endopeptidase (penicillin-binding protein 4)